MGSEQDANEKALELIGCITSRLLRKKSGVHKEDVIRTLHRIGKVTGDWQVRAGCKRAVQVLSHSVH